MPDNEYEPDMWEDRPAVVHPSDDELAQVLAVQEALQAMIALYGGERVAKWVRDLTFLIERKELP